MTMIEHRVDDANGTMVGSPWTSRQAASGGLGVDDWWWTGGQAFKGHDDGTKPLRALSLSHDLNWLSATVPGDVQEKSSVNHTQTAVLFYCNARCKR
jgi:hypothetical protein